MKKKCTHSFEGRIREYNYTLDCVEVYCSRCGEHLYDETDCEVSSYLNLSALEREIREVKKDIAFAKREGKSYSFFIELYARLKGLEALLYNR